MTTDRDKSEFHDDITYLSRIDRLFLLCHDARVNGNFYNLTRYLQAAFLELSTYFKDDEKKEKLNELVVLFGEVNNAVRISNRYGSTATTISPKLLWKLFEFELWLRGIYKESGLQSKLQEDARKALK